MPADRPNHHESWTPEQIAELMRLARQNLTAQEISIELGRRDEAVLLEAQQLDLVIITTLPPMRR